MAARSPRSHRRGGWLSIGQDDGVFKRAAVEAALAVYPFSGTHAVRFEEALLHQPSAASCAGRHHEPSAPSVRVPYPSRGRFDSPTEGEST